MQTIELYYYKDAGKTTITPVKRSDNDPVYAYRLIAEEGMELTNGEDRVPCIDTHTVEDWEEVPQDEEITADDLVEMLKELGVNV